MTYSPHQLAYFAHKLTLRGPADSMDRMAGALLDAQVDLNPHQIDAALFATSNPLSRGVILADEVGLGETIEAGLLIAQRWAERRRRIVVIAPANLRKQWHQELADKFGLAASILEAKSFRQAVKEGTGNPFEVGGVPQSGSLLQRDRFDQWVVNKEYNAEMLAAAVAKLEAFTFAPSAEVYWQHGFSTETDFIYVTTQTLNAEQLQALSDDVGPNRTLLVCCSAFRLSADAIAGRFPNLTVKKIAKMVLQKCEWGHDDYSLNVENLPASAAPARKPPAGPAEPRDARSSPPQAGLFDGTGS